jgi:hypothetical protein
MPCRTRKTGIATHDEPLYSPAIPAQPPVPVTLSRQQRRAMQRALEKAQRKQAAQTRRDAMRAVRLNAKQTGPTAPI